MSRHRAYFAYRLPNKKEVVFLHGRLVPVDHFEEIPINSIFIQSFDGTNKWLLKDLKDCLKEDFIIEHLSAPQSTTEQSEYNSQFAKLMQILNTNELSKAVLSRTINVEQNVDPIALFEQLNAIYDSTFNYLFSSEECGLWLGASPELLFELEEQRLRTISLAGTKSFEEDWTSKEQEEQKIVTDYLHDLLQQINAEEIKVSMPETISTGIVNHLKSAISAKIKDQHISALLNLFHPTPATCGFPIKTAEQLILEVETHQRRLYTGFIGVNNPKTTKVFVNLRCLEISKNSISLYVGGGITKDSELEKEWEETNRKAQTFLSLF